MYTRVCEMMRLEEKDYFGLTFVNDENSRVSGEIFLREFSFLVSFQAWLDNDKRVRSQLKGSNLFVYPHSSIIPSSRC